MVEIAASHMGSTDRTAIDAVRAELERRAVQLARVKEAVSTVESTGYVVFRIGGETYAVAASSVSAVFALTEMAVVPGAPGFVRGLTLFKGQVLPVLDLRVLVEARTDSLNDLARVVGIGRRRAEFGLLADAIEGMRDVASDEIRPAPRQSEDGGSRFVAGMTKDAVLLLDADALIRLFHGGGT